MLIKSEEQIVKITAKENEKENSGKNWDFQQQSKTADRRYMEEGELTFITKLLDIPKKRRDIMKRTVQNATRLISKHMGFTGSDILIRYCDDKNNEVTASASCKGDWKNVLSLKPKILDGVLEVRKGFHMGFAIDPEPETLNKSWFENIEGTKNNLDNFEETDYWKIEKLEDKSDSKTAQYKMWYKYKRNEKYFGLLTLNLTANSVMGHIDLCDTMKTTMEFVEKKIEIMKARINTWIDRAKLLMDVVQYIATTAITFGAATFANFGTIIQICRVFGTISGGLSTSLAVLNEGGFQVDDFTDNVFMKAFSTVFDILGAHFGPGDDMNHTNEEMKNKITQLQNKNNAIAKSK